MGRLILLWYIFFIISKVSKFLGSNLSDYDDLSENFIKFQNKFGIIKIDL